MRLGRREGKKDKMKEENMEGKEGLYMRRLGKEIK